ncbi:MAG: rhodanese-like domain-containing protein [Dehalococcoidales bacterium]
MKINIPKLVMLALSGLLIVPLALLNGCIGQEDTDSEAQIIEDVTLEEAYALIVDNLPNPDFIIIDVRTPEEYAEGHIEKAINLDFYSETFAAELDKLDKDKTYLIYCRTANRSGQALDMMAELGFIEVYNMLGGTLRWKAVGLPLLK